MIYFTGRTTQGSNNCLTVAAVFLLIIREADRSLLVVECACVCKVSTNGFQMSRRRTKYYSNVWCSHDTGEGIITGNSTRFRCTIIL